MIKRALFSLHFPDCILNGVSLSWYFSQKAPTETDSFFRKALLVLIGGRL
jgi:hypothetical protein